MVAPAFATISRGSKCFGDINSLGCIMEEPRFTVLHCDKTTCPRIHLFFRLHSNELYYILHVFLMEKFILDICKTSYV